MKYYVYDLSSKRYIDTSIVMMAMDSTLWEVVPTPDGEQLYRRDDWIAVFYSEIDNRGCDDHQIVRWEGCNTPIMH